MVVQKELLIHWWFYYGKCIFSLAELNEFEKVIDEYGADKVIDAAVASFICGDGSPTVMLLSIREGIVKELFESLPDVSKMKENERKQYNAIREEFIQIISGTA